MRLLPPARARPRLDFALSAINLIFLLMLFYLVAGNLIQPEEIEADAPLTRDLPLDRLPRPLLLVTTDALFLDGNPVAPASLVATLQAMPATLAGSPRLNILAERSVPAVALLDLVGTVQTRGIEVRLVTLHNTQHASPVRPEQDP